MFVTCPRTEIIQFSSLAQNEISITQGLKKCEPFCRFDSKVLKIDFFDQNLYLDFSLQSVMIHDQAGSVRFVID